MNYTADGGRITVRSAVRDRRAVLEVEDDGPGIPPAERERVFERFFRGAGASGEGCGLGLAIVRQIADAHGAAVSIADPPAGKGTLVRVAFPLAASPA
jgi:two-component system sensor histidine kinase TctE